MAKTAPHITTLLEQVAADHGSNAALTHGSKSWTYNELVLDSQEVASGLVDAGFRKGDRIAFWLPNRPAYLVMFLACARLGVTCVSINTRYGSWEVRDLMIRSKARGMFVASRYPGIQTRQILTEIGDDLTCVEIVIDVDEGDAILTGPVHLGLRGLTKAPYRACDADGTTPLVMFTTSGTTKAPKLVLHAQYSVAQHGLDIAADMDLQSSLQALPLCGVFGLAQAMGTLASGGHLVLMDAFDAPEAARLLTAHNIATLFGSDDLIDRLLAQSDEAIAFPDLKFAGFAAFNAALADLPERAHGRGLTLIGLYGMSECMALYARRDATSVLEDRRKAGGKSVSPQAQYKVLDPETDKALSQGEPGELVVKGPSLMLEYAGDPQATTDAFTADGYFRTGDLCVIEADGQLEFLGRMGDVLRLGGFLVNPLEIEAHLQSHPDIDAAQVVAITTRQGPRPVAFVVSVNGTPTESDLFDHCATLAKFKRPIRYITLDKFPVTQSANGTKIQRAKLREMALQAVDEA
jgi:fatty-acyl-CoA synthase